MTPLVGTSRRIGGLRGRGKNLCVGIVGAVAQLERRDQVRERRSARIEILCFLGRGEMSCRASVDFAGANEVPCEFRQAVGFQRQPMPKWSAWRSAGSSDASIASGAAGARCTSRVATSSPARCFRRGPPRCAAGDRRAASARASSSSVSLPPRHGEDSQNPHLRGVDLLQTGIDDLVERRRKAGAGKIAAVPLRVARRSSGFPREPSFERGEEGQRRPFAKRLFGERRRFLRPSAAQRHDCSIGSDSSSNESTKLRARWPRPISSGWYPTTNATGNRRRVRINVFDELARAGSLCSRSSTIKRTGPGRPESSQHAEERLAHPRAALAGRLKLGRIQVHLAPLQASPDLWHERRNVVRPRADYVCQLRVGGQLKRGGEGIMQRSVGDPQLVARCTVPGKR